MLRSSSKLHRPLLLASLLCLCLPGAARGAGAATARAADGARQAAGGERASDLKPISFAKASHAEVERETARLATLPGGWERTRAASEDFLGAPYRHSPLGEGAGVDPDPRLRWDAVDCITLIETSLALGEARSLAEVGPILDDIRYADGTAPSFEHRLHLMEAQWIPDLIRKGYVEEATRRLGGDATIELDLEYSKEIWAKRTNLLGHPWNEALQGRHVIPTIPLEAAIALAPTLPEGLILNVVRVPIPGKMNLVTHSGFVVIRDGKRYVRHAALGPKRVIDEPLEHFLRRHAQMRLRKVFGVNLLQVRGNAERVQRLVPPQRLSEADAGVLDPPDRR